MKTERHLKDTDKDHDQGSHAGNGSSKKPFTNLNKTRGDRSGRTLSSGVKVEFTDGEYKGETAEVTGSIANRYQKGEITYRLQVDGYPKPGGWDGQITATAKTLEANAIEVLEESEAQRQQTGKQMTRTKTVKSYKHNEPQKLIMRIVNVREETANDTDKSVEVVIATENPVERYDEDKDEVYNEILSMKGVKFRSKKNQLPIVDSHDRSTVRNVLGSVRNLRVEGTELVGSATFARDSDSQIAFDKLRDGHLTDFSITAQPNESERIQRGDVYMHGDVEISGPAEIVKSWTPTDASLVAAGADVTSTVRELLRAYTIPNRSKTMNAKLREQLIEKGMPDTIENAEEALTWRMAQDEATTERMDGEDEEDDEKEEVKSAVDRALATDGQRRKTIRALCEKAKIERELADKWCDDSEITIERAREKVLERMVNEPLGGTVRVIEDGHDSFVAAARTGLLQRAMSSMSNPTDTLREPIPDVPGAENFRARPLWRIAEEVLERAGVNTRSLSRKDVAEICLGRPGTINRNRTIMRDAYHTTGTFTNLLLDAKNKSLSQGYAEAFFTYNIWAAQGASVEDFKDIHRIRFSESPDPAVVPEGTPYPEKTVADAKETYRVEKYGNIFSTTWETIVNDDMSALSRIPMMHGNACRRKLNKLVYSCLTRGLTDTMSDGVLLFDASTHANYTASGTVISVANLNVGYSTMMLQTGLRGEIIGVVPRYLIMPPGISGTGLQIVNSMADVSIANERAINLYGPGGGRALIPVVEPQLAANDANAWYLAADSSAIDSVEYTFLAGEESPVLESEWDIKTDCFLNKVRQTYGAAPIDHRGLYLNAGA